MIYLITGSPGTGKTSMVVDMILNNADGLFKMETEDGTLIDRPLYFCHIDGLNTKKFKAHELSEEDIQSAPLSDLVPEGSIVIVDEADYTYPVRSAAAAVPPYIKTLKELRHHGYTLILMVQHPTMIDKYVRQLVGKHIHLERKVIGTKRYEWFRCEETLNTTAFASAIGSNYTPPKAAFKYYKSASKHIKFKKKIHPVFFFIPAAIAFMFYLGVPLFSKWLGNADPKAQETAKIERETPQNQTADPTIHTEKPQEMQPMQAAASIPEFSPEYYKPRVEDKPETAPIYDSVRAVRGFEIVAACVESLKSCNCYSQQGTLIEISAKTCKKHIKDGIFNPYKEEIQDAEHYSVAQQNINREQGGSVLVMGGRDKYLPAPSFGNGPPAQ
ncbi:Zonula occludens toxin [Kingella potus]|uniref:Zonula occludens toxin n=1 Tax=Kingella potus TaxID=265175 RepID=A0A377QXL5_9NEIS|nr:zonular occludens toxin domain-containing protein [Kingella potus]UOP01747.1 zonular occludens toxin domain-containing protein [Kingella potus]STQ99943.1 Zonula occludens toxin [Kingella potus]